VAASGVAELGADTKAAPRPADSADHSESHAGSGRGLPAGDVTAGPGAGSGWREAAPLSSLLDDEPVVTPVARDAARGKDARSLEPVAEPGGGELGERVGLTTERRPAVDRKSLLDRKAAVLSVEPEDAEPISPPQAGGSDLPEGADPRPSPVEEQADFTRLAPATEAPSGSEPGPVMAEHQEQPNGVLIVQGPPAATASGDLSERVAEPEPPFPLAADAGESLDGSQAAAGEGGFAGAFGQADAEAVEVAAPEVDDLGPIRPDFMRMVVDGVPIPDGGPVTRVVPAAKAERSAPRRAGGRPKPLSEAQLVAPAAPVPVGASASPVVVPLPSSRTAPAAESAPRPAGVPRRVKVQLARVSPWSIMKISFLLAVSLGIAFVVAVFVIWNVLDQAHLFVTVNEQIASIVGKESADRFDILQYVDRGKVMAAATGVAVLEIVLATALATLGSLIYNLTAALVGGVHVTLRDD
jgi:hypothetical protein